MADSETEVGNVTLADWESEPLAVSETAVGNVTLAVWASDAVADSITAAVNTFPASAEIAVVENA